MRLRLPEVCGAGIPLVFLASLCCTALGAEEGSSVNAAAGVQAFQTQGADPEGKKPSGTYPTQELKAKASDIERSYLAKRKVVADHTEEKWRKKVLKVKVSRYADFIQKEQKKVQDRENENNNKVMKVRSTEHSAKRAAHENADKSAAMDDKAAHGDERQKKANHALKEAIKQVVTLKNAEGEHANSDRHIAQAMLAKLRVAQAHADESIVGLTKKQYDNMYIANLHRSVELAAGAPTADHYNLAMKQIKVTTAHDTKESYEKIDEMNDKFERDTKAHQKKLSDAEKMKKHAKEVSAKRHAEKEGKRGEKISENLELPTKKIRENYDKLQGDEVRGKWQTHQKRITQELGVKGAMKTEKMMVFEKDQKKKKAAKEKVQKDECQRLEKNKMGALENRNKAIGDFDQARQNLIKAQDDMNNVKPYDPSKEKTVYVDKGPECVMANQGKHLIFQANAANLEACKQQCNSKDRANECNAINYPVNGGTCQLLRAGAVGDHPECTENPDGTCTIPDNMKSPAGCKLYQKLSGPGSAGFGRLSSRKLLGAGNDASSDVKAKPFQAKAPAKANSQRPLELTFEDSANEKQVKKEQKEHHENLNPLGESSRFLKGCWTKKCKDDKKRKKDQAERGQKDKEKAERSEKDAEKSKKAAEKAEKQQERQQKAQETAEAENNLNIMKGNHANAQANAKADAASELRRKAGEKAEEAEREKLQKGDEERTVKSEQSMKKESKAAAAANENAKKEALAEADRKAKNAENKMQESNVKAADADTQNRKCEGAMFRRRRTCACDDMPGKLLLEDETEDVRLGESTGMTKAHLEGVNKKSTMAQAGHQSAMANIAADEVRGKKEANYERRRYVRRRYVKPTAADRRRRYAFPAPPPPARVPGKVCPCCTKDSDNPECKKSNKGERSEL